MERESADVGLDSGADSDIAPRGGEKCHGELSPAWVRTVSTFEDSRFDRANYKLEIRVPGWRFGVYAEVESTDISDTAWRVGRYLRRKIFSDLEAAKRAAIKIEIDSWKRSIRQANAAIATLEGFAAQPIAPALPQASIATEASIPNLKDPSPESIG